ncbi:MAG: hypothetical protein P0Y64_01735 [Candidatus Sphingomonas colombiensis]|nr:hypothetical protein [Sphingomonas sp.]WEK43579.1 MAG: hypothetical protein P0Y64_01735 [Sphingomonas sp.]
MKTQFLIATTSIVAAVSLAAPASARTVAPPPVAPIAAPSTTPSPAQRICVVDTLTGSRIPTKVCHTRADWARLGIDPFAK